MALLYRLFGPLAPLSGCAVVIAMTLSAFSPSASAQEDRSVTAAVERIAGQSYRWETRVSDADANTSPDQGSRVVASGRRGPGGYVHVNGTLSNANAEFVVKDGKASVLSDGNWMTIEQAEERTGRGRGGRFRFGPRGPSLGETIGSFQTPAAKAIPLLESASNVQANENTITARLTSEAATELYNATNSGLGGRGRRGFAGRGRGRGNSSQPTVKADGNVVFTISDGVLTNVKISLDATETQGEAVTHTKRAIVTQFSKIRDSEFDLPLDARDIVDALVAGRKPNVFVPEQGFRKLFNGRDLGGWKGRDGFWTVEDGAIVGSSKDSTARTTSLIAQDGDENLEVSGFELRLSYRIAPDASEASKSAIQFRGRDQGDFVVTGYEATIANSGQEAGMLRDLAHSRNEMAAQGEVVYWNADGDKEVISRLGEADAIQAAIKKGDWNEYVIIANRNRVQHFVNGVPTVDVTDADASRQLTSGVLALALPAGEPMSVAFKDIRIRSISPIAETASAVLEVADGFQIEQIYQVPRGEEGSWVATCFDNKGRMIVSDQRGELYRVALPAIGQRTPIKPAPIGLGMGGAHGLLYAFDSLYSMGNGPDGTGLYRIRDTNGDDQYDEARLLREMRVGSDHSAHVAVLSPNGESLYVISGNQTELTRVNSSRVPKNMSEDHLLPRLETGFMGGTLAPGGWIARTDPNGEQWEFFAGGFRNEFDAAFNRDGELFTYDADMEWD
ncbi:MAG: DUF1080 domain-containing protein, partial [Planctomycetales bacterium]|nr:DUF1080 domain-containing protein [Planctomycetales bacterium]